MEFKKIEKFLKDYLDEELINDLPIPDELLDARTTNEKDERFSLIYHKLIGPLCITLKETIDRPLSIAELGFVAERVQAFLKEKGF